MKVIEPPNQSTFQLPDDSNQGSDEAADLIRRKLNGIYGQEPDAVSEAIESIQEPTKERSKHQKFMAELAASGKPFAQIQTEWHEYYLRLPDKEKHEVWNEFYSVREHKPKFEVQQPQTDLSGSKQAVTGSFAEPVGSKPKLSRPESVADLKKQIQSKVQSRTKLSHKQHFKSLGFGLAAGVVTVLILLFGFFNERFIAPFITPSRNVASTPLIGNGLSGSAGKDPILIIPKINVELPVVYDVATVDEHAIQAGLERGVVHYATTSNPGEQGNGAIFGHSSNNILNKGDYKFAFVLLSRLEAGDTFYIEKDGVRYAYKIFDKKIVPPSDTSVLASSSSKASTMTLITCDPPGTTINRLVVMGEQISPDPAQNIASTAVQTDDTPETLAGNPESLWSRMWNSVF